VPQQVHRPSELCKLCLTCRALKHHALPRLYEHVELVLPRNKVFVGILEQLIDPGADGLRYTKSLSISYRLPFSPELNDSDLTDCSHELVNDYDMNSDEESSEDEEYMVHRPRRNSAYFQLPNTAVTFSDPYQSPRKLQVGASSTFRSSR